MRCAILSAAVLLALSTSLYAQQTETLYLSGKGTDDPVKWQFMANAGMKANQWSTINVPANWELQGFGIYNYGRDQNPAAAGGWPKVRGHYRRTFTTPASWQGKKVNVVFEGVMTDAQVILNGQPVGEVHQGGFYRFKRNLTGGLRPGQENTIEVLVDDESLNQSVNNAERRGDYWNFGGIYRPVYLEAVPQQSIERVAIDAKADGTFTAHVFTSVGTAAAVEARLLDKDGQPAPEAFSPQLASDNNMGTVTAKVANPRLWTAETPHLYQLELRLKDLSGNVVHVVRQRFGFRTVEVRRPGDSPDGIGGVFVNGKRIIFKGVNRHTFYPDSGRATSEALSRADIELMKEMNMNAVRMSHYPPDKHFLELCDEMGMYVLDEIAGWHQRYDTPSGIRIVEETVTRDVNHPSILFWDNGNEGGWNTALDDEFAKWDPQKRLVLHPWETFRGIDTKHYPQYNDLVTRAGGQNPFFPTEVLHALYDGGAGAGLADYWKVLTESKVAAGGFIWAFSDECVVRTDQGGKLDPKGNQAPDGIVGPYREKEASFYTVKEIWAPIVVTAPPSPSTPFRVENRYSFTNADQCAFVWEVRAFKKPGDPGAGYTVMSTRTDKGRNLLPGTSATWEGWGPPSPTAASIAQERPDAIALTIKDPTGRTIWTHVWPSSQFGDEPLARRIAREVQQLPGAAKPAVTENADAFTATSGDLSLQFDRRTGRLNAATRAEKNFALANGPRLLNGLLPPPPARGRGTPAVVEPPAAPSLTAFQHKTDGDDVVLTATYAEVAAPARGGTGDFARRPGMSSITYRLKPNGWLQLDYAYFATGPNDFLGIGFDFPEAKLQSIRFLGNGPHPVWQNRLAGTNLDVWEKKLNGTIVGYPESLSPGQKFDYPETRGFYSGVRWMQFRSDVGPITVLNQEDLFVQALKPALPPESTQMQTVVSLPNADIAFLHAIPAIGSKFARATTTGPQGQPVQGAGEYKGSISFYFGALPK